jgi:hypothetical protein
MTLSSMKLTRRQASMYLYNMHGIEELRCRFNPAQSRLIPAHVTLCREDEVNDWSALQKRIDETLPIHLTLGFGSPVRDGNLVLLPAISGIEQFDDLRHRLHIGGLNGPRRHDPHITIIHPRNGKCTDAVFREISERIQPFTKTFHRISLIKQSDGGPWVRLAELGTDCG